MPQSVIHEMLYMKHPTRLKILQGVFLCSNLYVTSPETGAENFFSPAIGSSDQTKAADGGASPRQVHLIPMPESHWAVPHPANAIRRYTGDYSASAESCYRTSPRPLNF